MAEKKASRDDIKFVEELVDLHVKSLDLAMEQIKNGTHPYVVHLATCIVQSQSYELDDLRTWLVTQTGE